jgi:50S ribosomal protein L16 3-hydroxylase
VPVAPDHPLSEERFAARLAAGARLLRHPWARMAWAGGKTGGVLYVCGQAYGASVELAQRLCAERELAFDRTPVAADRELLLALVNDGHLLLRPARRRR